MFDIDEMEVSLKNANTLLLCLYGFFNEMDVRESSLISRINYSWPKGYKNLKES